MKREKQIVQSQLVNNGAQETSSSEISKCSQILSRMEIIFQLQIIFPNFTYLTAPHISLLLIQIYYYTESYYRLNTAMSHKLFSVYIEKCGRSQWLRVLRHLLSSTAKTLGSLGFESRSRHGCVSSFFCVMLSYVGRGLTTDRSPVQGVLPNFQK